MTRPRFTVRRLMLAVAVVGTVLGVTTERRNRFRRLRLIIGPSVEISLTDPPLSLSVISAKRSIVVLNGIIRCGSDTRTRPAIPGSRSPWTRPNRSDRRNDDAIFLGLRFTVLRLMIVGGGHCGRTGGLDRGAQAPSPERTDTPCVRRFTRSGRG